MDGISKKLIKDGIHSTIRVNFPRIGEFLATTLPSSAADEVSGAANDEQFSTDSSRCPAAAHAFVFTQLGER